MTIPTAVEQPAASQPVRLAHTVAALQVLEPRTGGGSRIGAPNRCVIIGLGAAMSWL